MALMLLGLVMPHEGPPNTRRITHCKAFYREKETAIHRLGKRSLIVYPFAAVRVRTTTCSVCLALNSAGEMQLEYRPWFLATFEGN